MLRAQRNNIVFNQVNGQIEFTHKTFKIRVYPLKGATHKKGTQYMKDKHLEGSSLEVFFFFFIIY